MKMNPDVLLYFSAKTEAVFPYTPKNYKKIKLCVTNVQFCVILQCD